MTNKYYVYAYLDPRKISTDYRFTNEPFYIGRGSDARLNYHINEVRKLPDIITREMFTKHRLNMIKINKIRSILDDGYEPVIIKLYENLSMEDSKEYEKKLIAEIGRSVFGEGPLTNLTEGGEGRHIVHAGRFNPFYGKRHSDEFRKQMSVLHSGKEISAEHRATISSKLKGVPKSRITVECRRTYMRKLHNDDPTNPMFTRLGERNSKTWCITSPTGQVIHVTSLRKFCIENNLKVKTLMSAYNKKRATRDGWHVSLISM
ncbi:hypothetical protein Xoosp13_282 [Xanthomonas phage Xoo-sp13]|nr:hypothetical protein Xoosp13_282 [Xanthomonas phage Xoo-sp13]